MARPRPSLARRIHADTPQPRLTPTTPPRLSLRSRFRRTHPLVNTWRTAAAATAATGGGGGGGGGNTGRSKSGIRAHGLLSRERIVRTIIAGRHIPADHINRWAAIQAGQLPHDDNTPLPPNPHQIEERERAELDDIHRWGEARNNTIREETHHQVHILNTQADHAEATYGPGRTAALRRAHRLREQANDAARDGQRRLDTVADQVREARTETRNRLRREADTAEEQVRTRINELRKGLNAEIQHTINTRYFHSNEFILDNFTII